jgi:hypothetical protein
VLALVFTTLESGIDVGVRLLIFELFSRATSLLKWAMFINFWIFLVLFFTFFTLAMYEKSKF